ncbi:hypothetical protein CHS0354_006118 [Potamilus streckersoni]|uniref:Uncharacterized protein n=1 Tax=Potamilus streckersoni TaxID=2493646 RepID=A0AAE0SU77_9BIVA|nr:hypothetical protein CHS0354_006118 [Potamilus streckersoni]
MAYPFLEELCLTVQFELDRTEFTIDAPWIIGAFFLGLIISGVITAICIILCFKDAERKKEACPPCFKCFNKQHDEEVAMLVSSGADNITTASYLEIGGKRIGRLGKDDKKGSAKNKGSLKTGKRDKGMKTDKRDEAVEKWAEPVEAAKNKDVPTLITSGMIYILVKKNSADAEQEMIKQDLDEFNKMEQDQEKQKDDMLIKLLKLRLKKLSEKGRVSEPYLADLVQQITDDKKSSQAVVDSERAENEEELKKKHAKNEKELQEALDNLDTDCNQKLRQLNKDQQENIRQKLLRTSGLSETEVDDLMEKLRQNMAELERKRGLEQARQARALAERLEKRRQILEFQRLQEAQNQEAVSGEVEAFIEPFDKLLKEGKIIERQKNELLDQYEKDLIAIHKRHEIDSMRQQQDLAEKLQQRREQRMRKLADKHAKEQALHLNKMEKEVKIEEFVKSYPDLLQQQQLELEEIQTELDQTEIQQMERVKMQLDKEKDGEIMEKRNKFVQTLSSIGQLSESDVNKIIKLHDIRMNAFMARQKEERARMTAKLQEKWEQRMMKLELESQKDSADRETIQEQQMATVKRVLSSNLELTDEAKKKILLEHERNMEALNNELQRSRMKQHLSLEHKLSQRRSRLAELQQKKEQAKLERKALTEKEIKALEDQLAAEEEKYEVERQAALSALRQKLAKETVAALAAQENELAALIGRLEAGHARREAILQKQDMTLQKLQEKLESKLTEGALAPSWADQIIQQHYNQLEHINSTVQHNREHQERVLTEKMQAKKLQRQRGLEEQIVKETHEDLMKRRRAGASKASQVLDQFLMEQRHQKAMDELEREMKLELERCKDQLNRDLHKELESELEEQKSQLLSQLAAACNLSSAEINEAVDTAVADTGADGRAAKKLAKELRQEINKAKTSMDLMEDDEEEEIGIRPKSAASRPKSSLRKKKS